MDNIIDFNSRSKVKNKGPEAVGETPKTVYDIVHEGLEYRFFIDIGTGSNKYVMRYLSKDKNLSPEDLINCVLSGKRPDTVKEMWKTVVSRTVTFSWPYKIIFLDNEREFLKYSSKKFYTYVNKLLIKIHNEIKRRRTASDSFLKSIETQV